MGLLVYFSSGSLNTHRFVMKTELQAHRIPCSMKEPVPEIREPYVLVLPTYAAGDGKGAVSKPVIRFLNDVKNRSFIRGVIAAGNSNFGSMFGIAGKVISEKCQVPYLYRFELAGSDEDVIRVKAGLEKFWGR